MPVIKTKGAASSQGFGEFAKSAAANYIEDVFSTYLYTGNGTTQTITNGIDLSGKGGLTWIKGRSGATDHALYDTARGATFDLVSNSSAAQTTQATGLTAFGSTGFSIGALAKLNTSAATYASWTFRKQPKFFDVVTYTGNGTTLTLSHNLGSAVGCIFVKSLDAVVTWKVWHRSLTSGNYLVLSGGQGQSAGSAAIIFGNNSITVDPTSTQFTVGSNICTSGEGYVAYIFAHDAGGFGLAGTDNVISCGSYTGDGLAAGPIVTLGYEPQWLLVKRSDTTGNWHLLDNMRGLPVGSADATFQANFNSAESSVEYVSPIATGFQVTSTSTQVNASGGTYIYIAIRRGPMKVPTLGTSVFSPIAVNAMQGTQQTTNFPVDMQLIANRGGETRNFSAVDRLRGVSTTTTSTYLGNITSSTDAESTSVAFATQNWNSTGFAISANTAETTALFHSFKRAPGFFDEVCYTGTGANATWTHNLGVAPEMMIVKKRSATANWAVYHSALTAAGYILLNTTAASSTASTFWQSTTPTSTSFYTGTNGNVGDSGATYVAYLFATCPGVSKVGSYTGTGATQTISCGFTGGARFVLVKRTDTTGDWYVWDTARGMVSGTDPSLLLNTTAAEVNANSIYTATGGFQIVSTAAGINASGGTYIFLAIA